MYGDICSVRAGFDLNNAIDCNHIGRPYIDAFSVMKNIVELHYKLIEKFH